MYHVPTLRQWIEDSWVDLCALVVVTALAAILNELDVASKRNFPVYIKTSTSGPIYPELAYPYRSATLAPWLDGLLAISIPTLFFIIAQIRIRSFYDLNTAFWGNMWGVATTSLFQVTIKTLIGGLRPHFLAVCNPSPQAIKAGSGQNLEEIMFDASVSLILFYKRVWITTSSCCCFQVCNPANSKDFKESLKSFPSGHTTTAAAGFVFLSLYFNAKMKIFADRRPRYCTLLFFLAPLLVVVLVGGVAILDHSHHWYDVVVGGVIGTFGAFAAFRMSYAAIWDYRFNHIPLPSSTSSWAPTFPRAPTNEKTKVQNHDFRPENFSYALGPSSDFPSWVNGWSKADVKKVPGMEGWRELKWPTRGAPGDAATAWGNA
ncbi:hypothetical protein FRC02_002691 [Tulasnella sp. 418]|nr:hypothetical protein FRC02_002691 [Tulasnella sp. 418]